MSWARECGGRFIMLMWNERGEANANVHRAAAAGSTLAFFLFFFILHNGIVFRTKTSSCSLSSRVLISVYFGPDEDDDDELKWSEVKWSEGMVDGSLAWSYDLRPRGGSSSR